MDKLRNYLVLYIPVHVARDEAVQTTIYEMGQLAGGYTIDEARGAWWAESGERNIDRIYKYTMWFKQEADAELKAYTEQLVHRICGDLREQTFMFEVSICHNTTPRSRFDVDRRMQEVSIVKVQDGEIVSAI